ncbi:hypothetical protein EW146_g759 [Bondarzewia mesenterica]|uniref:Phospholipid/glycerol acyltransferase domain-containing protein n=1 Tax=Bondarzewia mesenterica TaxID=1095465 RepID=A0A4S4M7T5_9AGAM|nr:hypothetical protein EW146_g759 [Bondarzewia mesenterica]
MGFLRALAIVILGVIQVSSLTWSETDFMFIFGDSYTTTGWNISAGIDSPVPGFTSSNGPNWVQYLGGTYNVTDTKVFNLAYGGATIDSALVPPYLPTVQSIVNQVSLFEQFLGHKPVGASWKSDNSLFAFWIGINDVGNSVSWTNVSQSAFHTTLMKRLFGQVEELYHSGARSFLFLTVPPTNRAPIFIVQGSSMTARVASSIADYNSQLRSFAKAFQQEHKDLDQVVVFDTQSIFNTLLDNAKTFGFVNASGYCDTYQNGTPSIATQVGPCAPVADYFWLNTLHPLFTVHDETCETATGQFEFTTHIVLDADLNMEPMLVYRALRKISDWTLTTFYSEVYVVGRENVPTDGPVIVYAGTLFSTHIATLAVTIPHRRRVSFWAKSSMFKSPFTRFIMVSSGSIPVSRNPNNAAATQSPSATPTPATKSLLSTTSRALSRQGVVGVFPEGTSYSEPRIMQVKGGAAIAALEYVKWESEMDDIGTHERPKKKLSLVPVGIVYTDKSQFLSRIVVRYGKPIPIDTYSEQYLSALTKSDTRVILGNLNAEIERRMFELTINAPDWETLYACQMSREILWCQTDVPLKDFTSISQTLVSIFTPQATSERQQHVKASLLKYASLLHYTGLRHNSLSSVLPRVGSQRPSSTSAPTVNQAARSLFYNLSVSLLHPRFLLFFPVFVLHIPAYCTSLLAVRFFADRELEETISQFKVIFGGIGLTASYGLVAALVVKAVKRVSMAQMPSGRLSAIVMSSGMLSRGDAGILARLLRTIGLGLVAYSAVRALAKRHKLLVKGNYAQFKRLIASYKVFRGVLSQPSLSIPVDRLNSSYLRPPIPPRNPFVKYPASTDDDPARGEREPPVPSYKLIRHLLEARERAVRDLVGYLQQQEVKHQDNMTPAWMDIQSRVKDLQKEIGLLFKDR